LDIISVDYRSDILHS